jgi:hypothetical protein
MAHQPTRNGLAIAEVEAVYDALALALDRAGEGKRELLLVKLALLQAQALGDAHEFHALLDTALRDL